MAEQYFIGVDVGGTKVAAGLVNSSGEITHQTRVPMVAADATAGLAAVTSAIDSVPAPHLVLIQSGRASSPALGSALPARSIRGRAWCSILRTSRAGAIFRWPPRYQKRTAFRFAWITTAMPQHWRKRCGALAVPIATSSAPPSAQASAPGLCSMAASITAVPGRPRKAATSPSITMDRAANAARWAASKFWRPGTAIARRASEQIAAGRHSAILEQAGGHIEGITGEMVGRAYAAGDSLAKEILQQTAMFLTVWLEVLSTCSSPT